MTPSTLKSIDTSKVKCAICGEKAHFIEAHILKAHNMGLEAYRNEYPTAPVLSEAAKAKLKEIERQARNTLEDVSISKVFGTSEVFAGITTCKAFKAPHKTTPEIDPDYRFRKDQLAAILYALENNVPTLLTGHTGTGKSSIVAQVAARLNRPFTRFQGDNDLTRADFVGQWTLINGKTVFQYGFLAIAMREGHMFLADEWDCVNPSVGMLLQSVLEGGNLTIPETSEVIKPHQNFRIFATSNTLGSGDETGLYSGTQPQNAAQLDRFGLVLVVDYPTKSEELDVLKKKTGIAPTLAERLVDVAALVRKAFVKNEIMAVMSTRSLINLACLMRDLGHYKLAYELGYLNRLSNDDKEVVKEFVQRVWG